MVQTVGQTIGIPQLLHTTVRGDGCPWCAGRAFSSKSLPVNDRCPPQLRFINMVVITPFVAPEAYPHDQAVQRTIEIPVAVFKVVDVPVALVVLVVSHPCRCAEAASHGPTFRRTTELPQMLDTVIDVPGVLIFPVVVQRQIPMVLLFSRPQKLPSCAWTRWSMPYLQVVHVFVLLS